LYCFLPSLARIAFIHNVQLIFPFFPPSLCPLTNLHFRLTEKAKHLRLPPSPPAHRNSSAFCR
jgi:hypothetical protein